MISILLGCGASLLGAFSPGRSWCGPTPSRLFSGRTASRGQKKGPESRSRRLGNTGSRLDPSFCLLLPYLFRVCQFFALLIGASLLTGLILISSAPGAQAASLPSGGLAGKVAAGNIRQNLGRTAVAVAAFMVALSMSIGLSSMIGSFRQSLIWWMGTQLQADLYIGKIDEVEVPESFYEEMRTLPGIGRGRPVPKRSGHLPGTPIYITAVDASVLQRYARFGWLKGGNENWEPVKKGGVIISESFQRRFGVKAGDQVVLEGSRAPPSSGRRGLLRLHLGARVMMMDRSTYLNIFGDRTINNLGIFIDPGNPGGRSSLTEVARRAQDRGLPVYTQDQLRENILAVFDTPLPSPGPCGLMAIIVAFFGIAGALLTLFMERRREFGIYRALGILHAPGGPHDPPGRPRHGAGQFSPERRRGNGPGLAADQGDQSQEFQLDDFLLPVLGALLMAAVTAVLASLGAAVYPSGRCAGPIRRCRSGRKDEEIADRKRSSPPFRRNLPCPLARHPRRHSNPPAN